MKTLMPAAALVLCATVSQVQTLPQIEAPIEAQVQASKFMGAVQHLTIDRR